MQRSDARFTGRAVVPAKEQERIHSVWRSAYGSIVTAIVRLEDGRTAGAYAVTGGWVRTKAALSLRSRPGTANCRSSPTSLR